MQLIERLTLAVDVVAQGYALGAHEGVVPVDAR
jgi:hypothetical protein